MRNIAKENPEIAPFLQPLVVAYLVFAFLSWTATSLFNVTLLASSFGRFVLTTHEKVFAGLHAVCLLVGSGLAIYGGVIGNGTFAWAGLGAVCMMIPVGAASNAHSPAAKGVIFTMVGAIAAIGGFAVLRLFLGLDPQPFAAIYILALVIFTWVGNLILSMLQR